MMAGIPSNSPKPKKISSAILFSTVLTLLAFFYYFIPAARFGFSPTFEGRLKNLIALAFFFYSIRYYRYLFKGKYARFNISLLVFCGIQVLSVVLNSDTMSTMSVMLVTEDVDSEIMGISSSSAAIFKSMMYFATALSFEKMSDSGLMNQVIKVLLYSFAVLVFIADFHAFFFVSSHNLVRGASYLVGDKFTLCYLNLFLCSLYALRHPSLRGQSFWMECFLVFVLFAISVYSQCSTALIGALVFAVLVLLMPIRRWVFFKSAWIVISSVLILDVLFFFIVSFLMQTSVVNFIVVNVLHEDPTLSGRLQIYMSIRQAFADSPWFGFGLGNSFVMSMSYADAPDVQNGLLDMFLQTGLFGCISFLAFLASAFIQVKKTDWYIFPIIALIYSMIVISMVEIPFNAHFIFFVMLLLLKRPVTQNGPSVANA